MRFVLLVLLFFPVVAFAGVFKCVQVGNTFYSDSPCVGSVPYEQRSTSSESGSGGSLIVPYDGSAYRLSASVSGVSSSFMIDTGATYTALSGDFAYRLGVRSCAAAGIANTANGSASFCRVVVPEIRFGPFVFINQTVSINPGMVGSSLIGNDLLSQFRVVSQNGSLVLSR